MIDQDELERLLGAASKAAVLAPRRSGKTVALARCMRRVASARPDLGLQLGVLACEQEEGFRADHPDLAALLDARHAYDDCALFLDEAFYYREHVLEALLRDPRHTHVYLFVTAGHPDQVALLTDLETRGFVVIEAPLLK